jgi:hypothetical protein
VKVARPVLRGPRDSDVPGLPDDYSYSDRSTDSGCVLTAVGGFDARPVATMPGGTDGTGPGASSTRWSAAKTVRSRAYGADGAGLAFGTLGSLPRLREALR